MLYDSASEPPTACDGGVLLSTNGLRALKALDASLYNRITTELASPVLEALWFDLEGELVRRTQLGQPPAAAPSSGTTPGGSSRRRSAMRRARSDGSNGAAAAAASSGSGAADPDAAAAPLVISLHDLREALAEALPEEVQIFGRHHVSSIEACPNDGAGGGGGGSVLRFSGSPSGAPVRAVRTQLVVGADGPQSAVKRLQFDGSQALYQEVQQQQQQAVSGRVVWRGRFTLRQRDPDFARLRNFTSATRTWVDLRATHGSQRTASLSPAGPNTYVWSASCPASLLASRGLQGVGQASAYWRCMAMFEDFPQDFFAALRATAGSAVVEYDTYPAPPPAAATGLAAPWRWFSGGAAALVGDAVYCLPVDDASSTAVNLALEDAAVLGACTAQYGLTSRALQEYARSRGPRVSALLASPSAPERARMRDALFLPTLPPPTALPQSATGGAAAADAAAAADSSLSSTVLSAVDSSAAAAVAMTSPPHPLEELLARAAAAAAAAAAVPESGLPGVPVSPALPPASRPSGGASRSLPMTATPAALPSPAGASSPLFSRPSGARRLGPMVPAAIAAMIGILAARAAASRTSGGGAAAAATEAAAADAVPPSATGADVSNTSDPPVSATEPPVAAASVPPSRIVETPSRPATTADASPRGVWESLLASHGSVPAAAAAAAHASAREYCSIGTPAAVWQALLVAPAKAHDMLVKLPYDAAESPALVWMALLATQPAAAAATLPASAAAAAAGSSAEPDVPCTLLPRPVLKQKSSAAAAPAAVTVAASAADELAPALHSEATSTIGVTEGSSAALRPAPSPPQQAPPPAVAGSRPAAGSGAEQQPRRRLRSPAAGPVSGRWTGADRRRGSGGGSSKVTGTYKTPRATAASAFRATDAAATADAAAAASTAAAASRAKAKTAATVTASLSAAAALGGVIGAAGTGHMPMMDVGAALHAHGAVSQFWEDLNNLTISSASLSSIDMS